MHEQILQRIESKLDKLLHETHALNARVTVLERMDTEVDAPSRAVVAELAREVERLKSQQVKATATAAGGGGLGVVAMVIEGVRLFLLGGSP